MAYCTTGRGQVQNSDSMDTPLVVPCSQLIPWGGVLLRKPTVVQVVQKVPVLDATQKFITMLPYPEHAESSQHTQNLLQEQLFNWNLLSCMFVLQDCINQLISVEWGLVW
jgi:hypothetical protein